MSQPALELIDLTKTFGDNRAVDGISLTLPKGRFQALLGANGAGKTTTMRLIAGLLLPDTGVVKIHGTSIADDPIAARRTIAWLPDEPLIYDKLSPVEYLEFIAGLWQLDRARAEADAVALLETLDLWSVRHDRCEGFSRGMRQKTALAGALLHNPTILLMDEPFSGLDAAITRQVKDLLLARVDGGATVVLTTHVMEIAERLAERIAIVDKGRVRAEGTMADLREAHGKPASTLEEIFIDLIDNRMTV
ncbi:MAG: ABC transporter ATP-binding protein [Hyphomonadaceae bacterium]|jgi:ABC-2 type transport system ATP-binding protein|nr:ABC transporter ATP-binding protein [Hyphomonadaceae bacterium]